MNPANRMDSFERLPEESFSRRTGGTRGRRSVSKGTNNAFDPSNATETTPQESYTRQWTEPTNNFGPWLVLVGSLGVLAGVAGTLFINRERFLH